MNVEDLLTVAGLLNVGDLTADTVGNAGLGDLGVGDGVGESNVLRANNSGHGQFANFEVGIRAIVNSALVSYERLPMLEVVFDRLVRLMSTSLRNFTSDNVEVSLDTITSIRFGDYLNSIPLPAVLSVIRATEWDNYGVITVDSALVYSIVDVLLGGRRGTALMRIEGRPYTTIERNLVERMVAVVLEDLSAAFEPLSPVTFSYDRLETNPRFATIARPGEAAAEPGEGGAAEGEGAVAAAEPAGGATLNPNSPFTAAELDMLQNLAFRREELDARDAELRLRANLLAVTEARIEERIAELRAVEATIQSLLITYDEQEEAQLQSVVSIYEAMKPKDAAKIFNELDMLILIELAERMRERLIVLADMDPTADNALTVELATRRSLPVTGRPAQ